MVNLLDIMRQAQAGSWMEGLGRPYGLSGQQSQHAIEALLPAFSLAFRQATRNPDAFAQLIEMMSSTRYLPFFERGAGGGFGTMPGGGQAGAEIVSRLFGPDEASRKVAEQASAMTGIATGVLHQMMPTMAAVMMGGLVRSLSVEGLSGVLRSWSDWLANLKRPEQRAPGADLGQFYATWGNTVAAMMGGAAPAPAPPPPPADPWSGMMQAIFGAAKPAPPPPPATPNPFEALAKMFETGRDVQAQYMANLQAVLNGAAGPRR